MFVYLDNNQFLVNTNCPIVVLMKYIKTRLGLAESELIDLCDEPGVLKFLFLLQNSQESARGLLKAKESFIVCIIRQSLQTQIDNLEKTRLKQLHIVEARMATSEEINAQALPTKSVSALEPHLNLTVLSYLFTCSHLLYYSA
uniref:Chromosome X open reading frame 65 n=1 Tax=Sinocyclocheilus rhinocerous TaxID=307959 RepID=A0A673K1R0_9TELE